MPYDGAAYCIDPILLVLQLRVECNHFGEQLWPQTCIEDHMHSGMNYACAERKVPWEIQVGMPWQVFICTLPMTDGVLEAVPYRCLQ